MGDSQNICNKSLNYLQRLHAEIVRHPTSQAFAARFQSLVRHLAALQPVRRDQTPPFSTARFLFAARCAGCAGCLKHRARPAFHFSLVAPCQSRLHPTSNVLMNYVLMNLRLAR